LKNKILFKLSTGEQSIAKLAREFNHVNKTGKNIGQLDYQRVYKAMTVLRDFHGKKEGFVQETKKFFKNNWRGRNDKIWTLTEKGVLALTKVQNYEEFFQMVFFMYDGHYVHEKYNIELSELLRYYETDNQLYRNKINSEIIITVWNDIKKIIHTEKYHNNIFPILKMIAIKKHMSEKQIKKYEKKNTEGENLDLFYYCFNQGLIMRIANEETYYLSIFGFLLLLSTFSLKKKYFDEEFEKEVNCIITNYRFMFPRITKDISHSNYTNIFRQIFLGISSTEDNESNLNETRLLAIQSYFEKIEQTRFRIFFNGFVNAYKKWCDKHDCNLFPFSSNFKMSPVHFLEILTDDDFSEDRSIIKGVIGEGKHNFELEIKEIHGCYLENITGEEYHFGTQDIELEKYEKLVMQINIIFLDGIQNESLKHNKIDKILEDFNDAEKENLKTKIVKAFENIQRLLKCKELLWELYRLSEKIEKIEEFDNTIDQRMQGFESIEQFKDDDDVKSLQDTIQFQFFTHLKSNNKQVWKNMLKKSKSIKWYEEWKKILIEFHNKENNEIELQELLT